MRRALLATCAAGALLAVPFTFSSTDNSQTLGKQAYVFDPGVMTANVCSGQGSKRGAFFKPDLAHILAGAVQASEPASMGVPLWDGLDSRPFTTSTNVPEAQAYYRQGFALLYGFNHWEAIRSFKKAQELDPTCAMCFWGEATAYAPNINAPMDAAGREAALAAMVKAVELKAGASAREKALIEAAEKRFSAEESADQAYADAMAAVHGAYPDDQDIATLYAEALMTTSPWDYWERDFTTPRAHIKTAIDTIEKVFAANPDHYGAIHLYIHLYEASTMAKKAEPYADKLAGLAPGSGHLVHMPGHIFFRIGRYKDSLSTNVDAVAVDEAYLGSTSGSPIYRYGYYPHNVHFILVSAQQAGDAKTSLEYAKKLDALIPMSVLDGAEWIAPIKAAPYFAYAQFADVETVMALSEPPDSQVYLKGLWHYARGLVLAEAGDDRSEAEKAAIDQLAGQTEDGGLPAKSVLTLASKSIAAKMALANGDAASSATLWREALAIQDSIAYMEPPFWYYAVEQSLAAALYEAGEYAEAERAFEASLIRHPNNAWSLFGLLKVQEKLGKTAAVSHTKGLIDEASMMEGTVPFIKL